MVETILVGRDTSSPSFVWGAVGKAYMSVAIAWTVILFSGIVWLIFHRNLYFLKMRNVFLVAASSILLHLYLPKILLAYSTNSYFTCTAEYWIMSIYLPLGIYVFALSMLQLQSVSDRQKQFLKSDPSLDKKSGSLQMEDQRGFHWLRNRWHRAIAARNAEVMITAGMFATVSPPRSLPRRSYCGSQPTKCATSDALLVFRDTGYLPRRSQVSHVLGLYRVRSTFE